MKLDIHNIAHHHNSPHESTSIMNGKHHHPLVEAAVGEEDEEQNHLIIPQNSTLSSQTPQSLPLMPDVSAAMVLNYFLSTCYHEQIIFIMNTLNFQACESQ